MKSIDSRKHPTHHFRCFNGDAVEAPCTCPPGARRSRSAAPPRPRHRRQRRPRRGRAGSVPPPGWSPRGRGCPRCWCLQIRAPRETIRKRWWKTRLYSIYVYMYICIYVNMYICKYVYMYICIYVYVSMCICVLYTCNTCIKRYIYIYICVYIDVLSITDCFFRSLGLWRYSVLSVKRSVLHLSSKA